MKMKFTLSLDDAQVEDRHFDSLILVWRENVSRQQVLSMSEQWIEDSNFLTNHMAGLKRVGESSLSIEPVEEEI